MNEDEDYFGSDNDEEVDRRVKIFLFNNLKNNNIKCSRQIKKVHKCYDKFK